MTDPTGVTPGVTGYKLQRDEVVKVAGTPFKRLLVYKLEVALPLPPEGVTLFAIQKDFVINSITTAATDPFENDADYIMYDVADGEVIGIVEVRGGKQGTFPMAVPDLPANLKGPCKILIRPRQGVQDIDGNLVFQIALSGPPVAGDGLIIVDNGGTVETVDLNEDGVPDELAEEVIPAPPYSPMETVDDFYAGYRAGLAGVTLP